MVVQYAPVYRTDLPLPDRREGKVRDIYRVPAAGRATGPRGQPDRTSSAVGSHAGDRILMVATDRISAFDVVMPTPIPGKGRILTDMSVRWFEFVRRLGIVADHLISTDPKDVPCLSERQQAEIEGRMTLGRAARVVPIECVVRGYLAGSGWLEYEQSGSVCGVQLPENLHRADRLPAPIFTPATKAEEGHDENIDFETACGIAGRDVMTQLRDISLALYAAAAAYAEPRGIILADTKFEFGFALDESGPPAGRPDNPPAGPPGGESEGRVTDELLLIDEVFTPDSSRFWPAEEYEPGREQKSFDKQYVRNYLLTLVESGKWQKSPPGPVLPDEIVANTLARYEEARSRLFD